MADLFSPLRISGIELPNRIVMAPAPSGYATADGFFSDELIAYYTRRARGGVGLIITERLRVLPPDPAQPVAHLGLYTDAFVPTLGRLARALHRHGTRLIVTLDEPTPPEPPDLAALTDLTEQFIGAAWRALCAGCDGVMLTSADGGIIHHLISPSLNQRNDPYGLTMAGRLRLPLEIIEGIRRWMGRRLIIGFRLLAEEFTPGGMGMHDARVVARRVTAAGAQILDVTVAEAPGVARFPGWAIPLANGIKRIASDAVVIGSGLLGDAPLADSIVRDGSVDMVMLQHTLRNNPDWPQQAYDELHTG
jgi:2,4-dienoyl-CoA reductase-like NADH-dependent reductase (Old Yellow Enzyme family)